MAMYWRKTQTRISKAWGGKSCSPKATPRVAIIDPRYIMVAPTLVFLHIFLICVWGPDRKQVPHRATTLPIVKQTAKGVGLPWRRLVKRKKEPKERRKPITVQERQP